MDIKEIGAKLRELRNKAGKTGKEVGEESGIYYKSIYNYENATRAIRADDFLKLLRVYGVRDVSKTFSDIQVDYDLLTDKEWTLIEHYRELPQSTRDIIDTLSNINDK